MTARHLYGIHDFDTRWASWLQEKNVTGWCVTTHALSSETDLYFFPTILEYGITPIARLNWGYGSTGTIPKPDNYGEYAQRCARFVERNEACRRFIIANEPNWSVEWPDGQMIHPSNYANCYRLAYDAIKKIRPDAQVIPAPVAPWNIESGMDWIDYWREMLSLLDGRVDALAIHTYSRGYDRSAIISDDKMNPPYESYYNGFRTYLDFLTAVPPKMHDLPVYITETNGNGPWPEDSSGWVQDAYAEIDRHNQQQGTQKIQALCLFRWPRFDSRWHIETKGGVHRDFQAALANEYKAGKTVTSTSTPIPSPATDEQPPNWDPRLDRRGTDYVPATVAKGETYWKLVSGEWLDENESQGKHHIFVEVLGDVGQRLTNIPVRFYWSTGNDARRTEAKPGENYAVDFPMHAAGWGYGIKVAEGESDAVEGLGLGSIEAPEMGIHTSYRFVFQRTVKEGSSIGLPIISPGPQPPVPPKGEPMSGWHAVVLPSSGLNIRSGPNTSSAIVAAAPEDAYLSLHTAIPDWLSVEYNGKQGYVASQYVMLTPGDEVNGQPDIPSSITPPSNKKSVTPTGDLFERSIDFVIEQEGGTSTDREDIGNYIGDKFVGTRYGISARSHPDVDVLNLTLEQAKEIYRTSYWIPSGANTMEWPLCLAVLDLAVNGGVGRAQQTLKATGHDFLKFMAWRIDWYTRLDQFDRYGRAWIRRCSALMMEAAK